MGKYIELDVAKKAFQNIDAGRAGGATLLSPEEFSEYLDEIPTADVVPVRHGYWLDAGCYDVGFLAVFMLWISQRSDSRAKAI